MLEDLKYIKDNIEKLSAIRIKRVVRLLRDLLETEEMFNKPKEDKEVKDAGEN